MRTAIITGADSGMGRAIAVALGKSGVDIGITYRTDEEGARNTVSAVVDEGRRCVRRQHDLRDLPDAADAVDHLADELGGVDMLVNNAGTGTRQLASEMEFDTWRSVVPPTSMRRSPALNEPCGGCWQRAAVVASSTSRACTNTLHEWVLLLTALPKLGWACSPRCSPWSWPSTASP